MAAMTSGQQAMKKRRKSLILYGLPASADSIHHPFFDPFVKA
jgi:hypothetical protein